MFVLNGVVIGVNGYNNCMNGCKKYRESQRFKIFMKREGSSALTITREIAFCYPWASLIVSSYGLRIGLLLLPILPIAV
jgi:hypothetical protein